MKPYKSFATRQTPQWEPAAGKAVVANHAGGYVFAVDDWIRLDRFIILGSAGNTYYCTERQMTRENAECVIRCIHADGQRTVNRIMELSQAGRAPKQDPALFALALCAGLGDPAVRRSAMAALPRVARTGTALFHFVQFCEQFRGWGRTLAGGIRAWYRDKDAQDLAYQMCKYQSRNGWSHRDLLRLSHVKAPSPECEALFRWAVAGPDSLGERTVDRRNRGVTRYAPTGALPEIVQAFEQAKRATTAEEIVALIRDHNLPRECVPTRFLTDAEVWEALLEKMPMTALIRNLATMTRVGLLAPMSAALDRVTAVLGDQQELRRARVHPIAVLAALTTYAQGCGQRGRHTWTPVPQIIDALDAAFYAAFQNAVPTGRRFYLGCDVSGSMWGGTIAGIPGLTPGVATGALAMVTARTEPQYYAAAFNTEMVPFDLSTHQRLDDVCSRMAALPWGGTDCALPMRDALNRKIPVEAFIIYTDSETWYGDIQPFQALQRYREKMGLAAKLIVVGMTATQFSIADPSDGGMMDIVGFDTATPTLIDDFVQA